MNINNLEKSLAVRCDKRIAEAMQDYKRHREYCPELLDKLEELDSIDSLGLYSLSKEIGPYGFGYDTIEGFEALNSFIGNFFDDSYVTMAVTEEEQERVDRINKRHREIAEKTGSPVIQMKPERTLSWFDGGHLSDSEILTEESLVKELDERIAAAKEFNKLSLDWDE